MRRWELRASHPVLDNLAAECSHVHLPDLQCEGAADLLPLLFSAAVACAVSDWAAVEFLLPRRRIGFPTPQVAGVRGVKPRVQVDDALVASQFGLSSNVSRAGWPQRKEAGFEDLEEPMVFAGQGSHVLRSQRTAWSSPFSRRGPWRLRRM